MSSSTRARRPDGPARRAPVQFLLFATAREAVGRGSLLREVPAAGLPLASLVGELVAEYPKLGPVIRHARLVRNGQYIRADHTRVRPGDEIAVHPPYSGG